MNMKKKLFPNLPVNFFRNFMVNSSFPRLLGKPLSGLSRNHEIGNQLPRKPFKILYSNNRKKAFIP